MIYQLGCFEWGVVEEFLDEINVTKQHSPATVAFQSKRIEGITIKHGR